MSVDDVLSRLSNVEEAMKAPEVEGELNSKKLNIAFALLAIGALEDYLQGDVDSAQSAFATLAEELRARRELE